MKRSVHKRPVSNQNGSMLGRGGGGGGREGDF